MTPDKEMLRSTVATLLAAAAATIGVYLWYLDLFSMQRVFAALLASELVIFSMLAYVFYKPSIDGETNTWLLLGCVTAGAFLLLAVQLGSR